MADAATVLSLTPAGALSAQDLEDLHALLALWRARQTWAQTPHVPAQLVRQTYHIHPRWIAAVRREARRNHESQASVVNRAFAEYFSGPPLDQGVPTPPWMQS